MKGIVINGANGRMGKALAEAVNSRSDCFVCAGMDIDRTAASSYLVFAPGEYEGEADAVIDCSNAAATDVILQYALRRRLPLVIMTTGQDDAQLERIKEASKTIPIFMSGNMSLGIAVLRKLAKQAAQILGEDYDIEIIEAHHNKKVDAPSGTALMLANAVSEGLNEPPVYVYDRHTVRKPRAHEEIGIHSIRGGTIVGEHEIIFAGRDEVIKLSHSAGSRTMFAGGAVNAALFISEKKNGMYSMDEMIGG